MDISQIIKIGLIVLDVLVVVFLLIHILKGYLKGTIRTSIVLATKLVPLIIFFIFSGAIAKGLAQMKINIPEIGQTTLSSYLTSIIVDSNPNLKSLMPYINDCMVSGIRVAINIAGIILVFLIISPILRFIFFLCFKSLRQNKPNLFSRLGGMGIAFAGYITLFALIMLPVYGGIEIANKASGFMLEETALIEEDEEMISQLEQIQTGTKGSFVLKITSSIGKNKNGTFGMGAKRLGSVLRIKTADVKINAVKEIDKLLPLAKRGLEIYGEVYESDNEIDINKIVNLLTDNDIDLIINFLGDSKLLKVAYPVLISYLEENEEISQLYDFDYEKLKEFDINENFKQASPLLKTILALAKNIDFNNTDNIGEYITDENINLLTQAINDAYNIELFSELFPKFICGFLKEQLINTEYAFISEWINVDYLKNDFSTDASYLAKAYSALNKTKLIDYIMQKEGEYIYTDEIALALGDFKTNFLQIKLLNNHYSELISELSDLIPDIEIPLDFKKMAEEDVNWNHEVGLLLDVFFSAYKLVLSVDITDDPLIILTSDETPICIKEIMNLILQSELVEKYYLKALQDLIIKYTTGTALEDFQSYFTIEYLKNDFKDDIVTIVEVYQIAKEIGLDAFFENQDINIDLSDEKTHAKAIEFVHKLLNLKIINNHEQQLWEKIIELSSLNEYADFSIDGDVDWNLEKNNLEKIIVAILDLNGIEKILDSNEKLDILEQREWIMKLANLFDQMALSNLTKKATFELLNKALEVVGYEITLTEGEKSAIINNTFTKEMTTLLDLIEIVNNNFVNNGEGLDLTKLDSRSVVNLMKKASQSIIASKIVGEILTDNLGAKGLGILPLDENGNSVYDFTNPAVLSSSADSIGALIDLYIIMDKIDVKNLSDDEIDDLTNTLSEFGQDNIDNKLVNDFLSEMCEDNNLQFSDNINWNEEGKVINDVLKAYQASSNQDNFVVEDPALLTRLSESEVAETILRYLDIIQ